MKKYLVVLMALVMVLGFSGKAMGLATANIPVTATVASFAAITDIGIISLAFTGAADQEVTGSDIITVERNTSVNVAISTTTLTGPGGDTILTSVSPEFTSLVGAGISDIEVEVTGTTGAISEQSAGVYTATVTVTVSAI